MTSRLLRFSRRPVTLVLALITLGGSLGASVGTTSAAYFTDIATSPFQTEILWLADVGVTSGCGDGRFCPKGYVTRGEMASFLARSLKLPSTSRDYYRDDETSTHEQNINRLSEAGITSGCGDRLFCPAAVVTRAHMASFLARALQLPSTSRDHYRDDENSPHEANINRFAEAGITGGCGDGLFCPDGAVVREQMAAFLYRARSRLDLVPMSSDPTGVTVRPYTDASAWNTPIGTSPAVDRSSPQMISTITQEVSSNHAQYTYPVYVADSTTPRHSISCRVYRCTVITADGHTTTQTLTGVPIPPEARPSAGRDAQMIIIDPSTGTEWDLWQASFDGMSWSVSNGSVYNVNWDGMPPRYGSRGAGVPYLAGLIRPWEIAAGRVDHALAFGYPSPRASRCVWPASKTDGEASDAYAIPEGARLQLDPRFTDEDFRSWGLDRTGRIIARAMQEYGMFLIDVSGRPKIYVENLEANPYALASWSDPALRLAADTVAAIPVSGLRVLKLPDAYWSGATSPAHGNCVK